MKDVKVKKIYALNKIAYLLSNDIIPENIVLDNDSNYVYYIFPQDEVVNTAIENYKNDIFIHRFIREYGNVINKIKELKKEEEHGI